ncbi:MAG TPA: hypothetical protein VHG92_11430 [Afifellaceae bacterium]|nr:hypothetical protein [Afifellaceae bacterium]
MAEIQQPYEAEIVHQLPADLEALIGRVIVRYAKLEYKLTMLTGLLLQLNKPETRIALRTPRAVERLEMALDLFAIKAIPVRMDAQALRETLSQATSGRDVLAHGLWLQHPETKALHLRLARGSWPKDMSKGERVSRAIFPQAIPYGTEDCKQTLGLIDQALAGVEHLGKEIDDALEAFPERFREPAPVLNPLGRRNPKGSAPPRGSSEA